MNIEQENILLEEIAEKEGNVIYCNAEANWYGKPFVIHLEGAFTPEVLRKIADIAERINK